MPKSTLTLPGLSSHIVFVSLKMDMAMGIDETGSHSHVACNMYPVANSRTSYMSGEIFKGIPKHSSNIICKNMEFLKCFLINIAFF